MKKYLIILILLAASPAWGATYYGGAASKDINADDLWYAAVSGSCAGSDSPVNWATASANGNKLIANGCTITIPNTSTQTIPATGSITISNKTDGASNVVDGGQFTYATSATYTVTLQASIETGATLHALAISGSANPGSLGDVFIIGSSGTPITITGGTASTKYGVSDTKTGTNARVTVYGTVTGGTNANAIGYASSGASGTVTINGTCTMQSSGASGTGCSCSGGTMSVTNCTGTASTSYINAACYGGGAGGLTVTDNITNGSATVGVVGKIIWTPTAPSDGVTGSYVKFDGGGTAVFVGKNTDDATKALSTFYYIDPTDGTSDQGSATGGGGGGAWGF